MKEATWREAEPAAAVAGFPVAVPPAFAELIAEAEKAGNAEAAAALKREVYPSDEESAVLPRETSDPLGEARFAVLPRLVHQYKSRVLLLSTSRCIGYCRYCFRRGFASLEPNAQLIAGDELEEACGYIASHPEIEEALVSGGDPLSAPFDALLALLSRLRKIRPQLVLRLCTRAPIFAPNLFTEERVAALRELRPLWLVPHINHPAELGLKQRECVSLFVGSGLPVFSQTVLLQGVNDSAPCLHGLFSALVRIGVKPGYLFQCDMAPGTGHFRVPLGKALSLWRELTKELSGLSRPAFAVDLPAGGGKFPLAAAAFKDDILSCDDGGIVVRT